MHSVLLCSAIEMKHSCVLILPNGPPLCQDYMGEVKGYRNRTGRRRVMRECHKEQHAGQHFKSLERAPFSDSYQFLHNRRS